MEIFLTGASCNECPFEATEFDAINGHIEETKHVLSVQGYTDSNPEKAQEEIEI